MQAMNEVKKCPKCGGEMKKGSLFGSMGTFVEFSDKESESFWSLGNTSKINAYACKTCGYVEIYTEALAHE